MMEVECNPIFIASFQEKKTAQAPCPIKTNIICHHCRSYSLAASIAAGGAAPPVFGLFIKKIKSLASKPMGMGERHEGERILTGQRTL